MAIVESERIFDLAYGAKMAPEQIASILPASLKTVKETLANLALGPSSQTAPAAVAEVAAGGVGALMFGGLKQTSNTARPARSNIDYLGYSGSKGAEVVKTKYSGFVAVPVRPGDIFTKVGVLTSEKAGGTIAHQCVSVYEGKGAAPKLIVQSADTTSAAMAKWSLLGYTLESAVTVTETNAPNGYLYAGWAYEATTPPTTVNGQLEAKVQQALSAKTGFTVTGKEPPIFLAATTKPAAEPGIKAESELKEGTAELTLATEAPFVFLY